MDKNEVGELRRLLYYFQKEYANGVFAIDTVIEEIDWVLERLEGDEK